MTANDEVAVLVPRVKSFTNQYVTKAGYIEGEDLIKSLKVLIFNDDGTFVYAQDMPVDTRSLMLNKSMLNSPAHKDKLSNATVVMLANMDLNLLKKINGETVHSNLSSLTITELAGSTYYPEKNIIFPSELGNEGFDGFPMIGGVSGVVLTPTSATQQQYPIVIDLRVLFAKIEFEIHVEQGSEEQGEGMQFTLDKWAINNVSEATTLAVPTDNGLPVRDFMGNIPDVENIATVDGATISTDYTTNEVSGNLPDIKTTALNGSPLKFTFYMAESRYNPGAYTYPIENLHESFKQQFKPQVADAEGGLPTAGRASYVLLEGKYIDYRGTSWNVDYKIYLGKNSYDNFHVDRNSLYKNIISIKGIRDRQKDSYGEGDVWIDHRVNVEYDGDSADDCVTITRETLIDSHIEVRPLRVKYGSDYQFAVIYLPKYPLDQNGNIIYGTAEPKSWGQVLETEGGENENWIALENNNGKYNKGKLYCTNGKRKYFTTSLIEELHLDNDAEQNGIRSDDNGRRYIILNSEDCAWIYFDENTTTNTRRALIDVEFYRSNGSKVVETYEIIQSGLKEAGKYKIERYEEYLHSYDSEDEFGLATSPTDYTQQGLSWGFFNQAISQDIIVSATPLSGINLGGSDIIDFRPLVEQRYDYFHESDVPNPPYYLYTKNDNDAWTDASYGTGLTFTDRASRNEFITVKDMGTRPTSAYQYCLSKNKFKEDPNGEEHQMIIHWYLPDAYELRDVLNVGSSNSESDIFKTDAYYWSSQPSFDGISINLGTELSIKNEAPAKARAVSKDGIVDIERNQQNRIRCFYDPTGIQADMNERVPDGLGGLIKVPMRAFDEDNSRGYFYDWLQDFDDLDDLEDTPTLPSYNFPTGKDFETFKTFTHNNVKYCAVDPSDKNNWSYELTSQTLYYYPGLSSKNVQIGTDLIYREQLTDKEYKRTETDKEGKKIEAIPSNEDLALHPLDLYLEDDKSTGILTISFGKGDGSQSPSYSYRREDKVTISTYTQLWEVPEYDEVEIDEPSGSQLGEIKLETQLASAIYLWYQEGGTYDYNGKIYTIKEKYTESSGFMGLTIKYYFVLTLGDEEITIEVKDQLASAIYNNYKKGDNYLHDGVLYKIENKRYSWGSYYFTLGPTTIEKTVYQYKANTGGWGNEKKSTSDGNKQAVTDKLELYGGNNFTISAIDGYRIRSLRVNYSGSNNVERTISGENNNRFLRLVDARIGLPLSQNISPDNMSYSPDGERGWFKWTASSDDDLVSDLTLTLATYTVTESYSIFGYQVPSSFRYIKSTNEDWYDSDFNTSIVIDSIEIRIEEVE